MKTLKQILTIALLTSIFYSCTPDSLSDDRSATGGDDATTVDNKRD